MKQNQTKARQDVNLVLDKLVSELEAARKQITKQEFKIEVLARQILQLRADQLGFESRSKHEVSLGVKC